MEEMEDTGGKNQFNYSERAAQTYAPTMKVNIEYEWLISLLLTEIVLHVSF